ncbi:MAG TPA: DUF1003 domain-containing protein [Armatimonadota bacterium]|jgi:uncharacterized membrane protein
MPEQIKSVGPAAKYTHDHPPVRNVNEIHEKQRTIGQRVADRVADLIGSWPFIIIQSVVLSLWIVANVYVAVHWKDKAFDPYPFILLNLVLSFQAAYTGPIVMMSQNRQALKDRLMAENDFEVNRKAEDEVKVVLEHLVYQDGIMSDIIGRLVAMEESRADSRKAYAAERGEAPATADGGNGQAA